MTPLSQSCRQLIVETALAGVNHGLFTESRAILAALPLLVPDPEVRLLCQAMLLFGLGEAPQALQLLKESQSIEALTLRQLLAPELFQQEQLFQIEHGKAHNLPSLRNENGANNK